MSEDTGACIAVVDDDLEVRRSLGRLLRAAGYEVRAFATAEEFLNQAELRAIDCLLLDLQLPTMGGLALQEALRAQEQCPPIVFLTGHGTVSGAVKAIQVGAIDMLTKPCPAEYLLGAVTRALAAGAQKRSLDRDRQEAQLRVARLSPREREVLRGVVSGLLNKQIGAVLGISEKTIKVHRGQVMAKLGVRSVVDLVRLCKQTGDHDLDLPPH
jgi:FixJ family two-component response regulator